MYGVGFGVFAGWVPGLGIFAFRGHRENVRRVKAVVIERYEAYWQERCEAQRACSTEPTRHTWPLASVRITLLSSRHDHASSAL